MLSGEDFLSLLTDPKFAGLGTIVVSMKFAVVNLPPPLFKEAAFDETADDKGNCEDEGVCLYNGDTGDSLRDDSARLPADIEFFTGTLSLV
jgi:hypothetical protein